MRISNHAKTLALAVVLLLGGVSTAQPPAGPQLAPTFSPYLNLARRNGNPAINYYGIVRPQAQANNAIQSLENQSGAVNPFQNSGNSGEQPVVTGNGFGFQSHRTYFQNQFQYGGFSNVNNRPMIPSQGAPQAPSPQSASPSRR